jgi:hypothetical protein
MRFSLYKISILGLLLAMFTSSCGSMGLCMPSYEIVFEESEQEEDAECSSTQTINTLQQSGSGSGSKNTSVCANVSVCASAFPVFQKDFLQASIAGSLLQQYLSRLRNSLHTTPYYCLYCCHKYDLI